MDLSPKMLSRVSSEAAWGKVGGDVRAMPLADGSVDVVVARYGVKDLPVEQQPGALTEMVRVIRPGGRLVIADMVAPEGTQAWLNGHHALKQELGGRDPRTEGTCHIPTKREWITRLTESGLVDIGSDDYVSQVATQAWVDGKQIDGVQQRIMDQDILNAPQSIKGAFKIRQEGESVRIDYPVVILQARKPLVV